MSAVIGKSDLAAINSPFASSPSPSFPTSPSPSPSRHGIHGVQSVIQVVALCQPGQLLIKKIKEGQ